MAKTVTLEALRQTVLDRDAKLSDRMVSVKSLFMDPDQPGRMVLRNQGRDRDESFVMDNRVYGQLPQITYGLPGSYVKKLIDGDHPDPDLAARNFNYWVDCSKEREVLCRFKEEKDGSKTIRALKPGTWNPVPYQDSLDTFITKFGPEHQVGVERFDDTGLVLNFIAKKLDYKTNPKIHDIGKRDDPIEWGFRWSDSDAGVGDITTSPYIRRLICMNGATTMSKGICIRISHSNKESSDPMNVQSLIRQSAEMVDGHSTKMSERITDAQGIELDVDDEGVPQAAMKRLERDLLVTRLQQRHVLEAWEVEQESIPERSLYRLHNAVTRAGTHAEELTPEARLHLQSVGGRMLELAGSGHYWN